MLRSRKTRLIRRVRTLRRRQLQPRLAELERRLAGVWTRPGRRSVAWHLGRLAAAVDGSVAAAGRIAAAEERMSREMARLAELPRASRTGGGGGVEPPRRGAAPGSLPIALSVTLVALALAAGNVWLLDTHLIPAVLEAGYMGAGLASGPWVAVAFSALALALGMFHYALFTAGRSAGLRVLGVLAMALLVGQGALQGAATVVAVDAWVGAVWHTWAGLGAVALLAGAAGLVPAVMGAAAHGALNHLGRWSAGREYRSADRLVRTHERVIRRVDRSLDDLATGLAALRTESSTVPESDVALLLVRPEPAPTVHRLGTILRRLAIAVERDPEPRPATASAAVLELLTSLGALVLWVLASAATLAIAWPATSAAAMAGLALPVAAGTIAALAGLLVGGLVLRLALDRPGRTTSTVVGAAAVALLGVASASAAIGLGAFAAGAGPFAADPLAAAALLNALILAAAIGSSRLPEGIRAVGTVFWLIVLGATWTAITVVDGAAALADRAMVGYRRAARAESLRPQRSAPRPAVEGIGTGRDAR